jgi:hypothetical protein
MHSDLLTALENNLLHRFLLAVPSWIELRVAQLQPYRDVAFFHHLILEKKRLLNDADK